MVFTVSVLPSLSPSFTKTVVPFNVWSSFTVAISLFANKTSLTAFTVIVTVALSQSPSTSHT